MADPTITHAQLADAVRDHLDVDPDDIAGLALGLDPSDVVSLSADPHEVRYVTASVVDHKIVESETVIRVEWDGT